MNQASPRFGPGGSCELFYASGNKHTVEAPAFLSALGLTAYEYEAGRGIPSNRAALAAVGEAAKAHGIRMSLHAPYFISLSSVDPEKRSNSVRYIKESLDAAALLGAEIIVVHCGGTAKMERSEAMRLSLDTLYSALEQIPETPIKIGMETMGKVNQLGTLPEVLTLCKLSPRLAPVVDFGHLHARDQGRVLNTADEFLRVFDDISSALGAEYAETLHCHFSKIAWTEAGEKKHITFADAGYGPDFRPLMEAILRAGASPTVISESAGTQTADSLTMQEYFRALQEE